MQNLLRSSLVLAVVIAAFACSGSFTSGPNGPFSPGDGPGGTAVAGDGGADAGDAGPFDGGDAGNQSCNGLPSGMNIVDFCGGSAVATALTVTQNGCVATFTFAGTSTPCTGQLIGPNDGFDGGCSGLALTNCTSLSVPGTITCNTGGTPATCQLKVCGADAGTCP